MIVHLPLPFIIGIQTTNPSAVLSNFCIYFSFSYFLIGGNLYVIIEIFSFYSVVFVCFPSIQCSPFCLARTIDILELQEIILLQAFTISLEFLHIEIARANLLARAFLLYFKFNVLHLLIHEVVFKVRIFQLTRAQTEVIHNHKRQLIFAKFRHF